MEWKKRNKERVSKYMEYWREKNKEHVASYSRKYREKNAERRRAEKDRWRKNNIDRVRKYARDRYAENICHKLSHKMRSMVYRVASKGGSSSLEYTSDQLRQRIEVQFKKGMDWSNYGEWEIDHKIPVSVFVEKGFLVPSVINALSNLQPLWMSENRSKGNRYIG